MRERRVNSSVSSVYSVSSVHVGARQDQPRYAVGEFRYVEVDDQAQRNVKQFHVAQQLRLVNRHDVLNGFDFHLEAAIDEDIELENFVENQVLVANLHLALIDCRYAAQAKFVQQATLVNALEESWPQRLVNYNRRADDNVA